MITVSTGIVTAISDSVSSAIQDLWVIFALLIGITVTFFILRKIIFLFTIAKR